MMHQRYDNDPGPDNPGPDLHRVAHDPNVTGVYLSPPGRGRGPSTHAPVTCFFEWDESPEARPRKRMPGLHIQ